MNLVRLVDLCSVRGRIGPLPAPISDWVLSGPAVLAIVDNVHLEQCNFALDGAPYDSLFITVPDGTTLLGVIGLDNVHILRCEFRDVSFIGNPAQIAQLRAGIADNRVIAPPPFYQHLAGELPTEDARADAS